MPRYPSARRYAQAVFQIALEHDSLDVWVEDLQTLADLLDDSDVAQFLDAPQVPDARKLETIQQLLGDSVGTLAANLLGLLATKNMTLLMPGILEQFTVMVDRHRGIEWADVTTAVPLDDARRDEVAQLLSGIVGSEVSLRTYVEPGADRRHDSPAERQGDRRQCTQQTEEHAPAGSGTNFVERSAYCLPTNEQCAIAGGLHGSTRTGHSVRNQAPDRGVWSGTHDGRRWHRR